VNAGGEGVGRIGTPGFTRGRYGFVAGVEPVVKVRCNLIRVWIIGLL